MQKFTNVDGETSTCNLPKRSKNFKEFLQALEYAPLEDEILETQFSMVSPSLARRLDSRDKFGKKCFSADTTNLQLEVDGKVFPTTGFTLGNKSDIWNHIEVYKNI